MGRGPMLPLAALAALACGPGFGQGPGAPQEGSGGPGQAQPDTLSATACVVDVSGSMEMEWPGGRKIDSAKDALSAAANLVAHDSHALSLPHALGIVQFSTSGAVVLPLTTDLTQAAPAIDSLEPSGGTNLGEGLQLGLIEVRDGAAARHRFIILLSDGMANEGMDADEIMAGPVDGCAGEAVPVYVCGYGDPNDPSSMNQDLLQAIADATGGSYYYASNGMELEDIYVRIRHESLGQILSDITGEISQDETVDQALQVASQTDELHVTVNWPGSRLDMLLTDPSGTSVDASYPGASIVDTVKPIYAIIANPMPGAWGVKITGRDVPQGTTRYRLISSSRIAGGGGVGMGPIIRRGGHGWVVGLMAFVLAMCAAMIVAIALVLLRRGDPGQPPSFLVTAEGDHPAFPVDRPNFVLGRAEGADLRFADPTVSSVHAVLVHSPQCMLHDRTRW